MQPRISPSQPFVCAASMMLEATLFRVRRNHARHNLAIDDVARGARRPASGRATSMPQLVAQPLAIETARPWVKRVA